jgi:hypothetical protein
MDTRQLQAAMDDFMDVVDQEGRIINGVFAGAVLTGIVVELYSGNTTLLKVATELVGLERLSDALFHIKSYTLHKNSSRAALCVGSATDLARFVIAYYLANNQVENRVPYYLVYPDMLPHTFNLVANGARYLYQKAYGLPFFASRPATPEAATLPAASTPAKNPRHEKRA